MSTPTRRRVALLALAAAIALPLAASSRDVALGQSALANVDYRRVVVQDGYAYVGTYNDYFLRVLTLVDPNRPAQSGAFRAPSSVADWAVSGRYAYLTNGYQLTVVDVADPTHPTSLGEPGGYVKRATRLAVAADVLYVAFFAVDARVRLGLWSLADPARPTQLGTGDVDQPATAASTPVVAAGYAYVGTNLGLFVFDVRDPARPVQIAFYPAPGPGTYQAQGVCVIAVDGANAYLGVPDGTLRILDVSDPARPTLVSQGSSPGGVWYAAIIVGGRLYAATDAGLQVLGLADPTRPTFLGGETRTHRAYDVGVAGSRAYVASADEGLRVLDVSDPAALRLVGTAVLAQLRLADVPNHAPAS